MWGMIRADTSTTLRYLFKSYALRAASPLWPLKKPETHRAKKVQQKSEVAPSSLRAESSFRGSGFRV